MTKAIIVVLCGVGYYLSLSFIYHSYYTCVYKSDVIWSSQRSFVGTMEGELKPMDYENDLEDEDVYENGEENDTESLRLQWFGLSHVFSFIFQIVFFNLVHFTYYPQ